MNLRRACDGRIHRYGEAYLCPAPSVYVLKENTNVKTSCKQHLAQVLDGMRDPASPVVEVFFFADVEAAVEGL